MSVIGGGGSGGRCCGLKSDSFQFSMFLSSVSVNAASLHLLIALVILTSTALAWPSSLDIFARTAKVLNFFPIPVSEECQANDGRRTGVCLNPYECRIQHGEPMGPCALGFGVCCVFTATCDGEIENNVTYFVSPDFPGLTQKEENGQPNRRTGVCEVDKFTLSGGSSIDITLCGQNSGQHLYYDVDNVKDPVTITMNMTQDNLFRIWEIKVTQIELNRRAPPGCRQYFQSPQGTIQTINYAVNGRHLANQDYKICVRQEENMCSIAYEPCDENSFKIGPPISADDPGSGDGPSINSLAEFRECGDRIIMPCDTEDFIMPGGSMGMCNLLHCGNTFCSSGSKPCRIESSVKPFNIQVKFGPGTKEENPEDNLGMCLKYEQLPCT